MRVEYIFLTILSLLPLMYKIWYWQRILLELKSKKQSFRKYLLSKQGRESCFHFWTLLEFPILLVWFFPLTDSNFEYLWYPMFFYFMLIYNIYVIWKVFRKKIFFPRINLIFLWIVVFSLSLLSLSSVYPQSIYILISSILLIIPFIFLVWEIVYSLIWKQSKAYK